MPRLRKVAINQTVVFVTFGIEQGLLLRPNELMIAIVKSCLARAQAQYPIKLCHFIVEDTHLHLIIVVQDPELISGFVRRFKTESAHAINRLLGRKKRTVWCEGYDSPMLATAEDVVNKIVYLYCNPSKDGLENSIEQYPGLSSWEMFRSGTHSFWHPCYNRSSYKKLHSFALSPNSARNIVNDLNESAPHWNLFELNPNAWMECFEITQPEEVTSINQEIIARIKSSEALHRKNRRERGKSVLGRSKLIRLALDPEYLPNRKGKRTWVICLDRKIRRKIIEFISFISNIAREVYLSWKSGDFTPQIPPGLYPPSMPKLAEFAPASLVFSR